MQRSKIIGIGTHLPERIVTNHDLEKMMETSDEWIVQRSGIKERRYVAPHESNSDLGLIAAEKALKNSGITKEQIDLIIYATLSPDHEFPGTGCFLQAKMGLTNIPALDIRQQCTGFIYGLSIADQFIRTGMYKNILLVGGEVHSKGLDLTTRGRDTGVLFGDGAGAAVITATEVTNPETDSYLYSTHLYADGSQAKELWIPAPGVGLGRADRMSYAILDEGLHFPKMNGKKVFMAAVKNMSESLMDCLHKNNKKVEDIDLFLFHQANLRINDAVADMLKITQEKVFNTIEKYGNTTAATIPIGMDEAMKAGKLKPGMLVGLSAFGSGFTWAAGLLRF
jgi:3-oxoacyl-[acyl-carrier-protein] synthase-3